MDVMITVTKPSQRAYEGRWGAFNPLCWERCSGGYDGEKINECKDKLSWCAKRNLTGKKESGGEKAKLSQTNRAGTCTAGEILEMRPKGFYKRIRSHRDL